jgi:hypothetical protein
LTKFAASSLRRVIASDRVGGLSFQLPATIGRRGIVLPSPLAAPPAAADDDDDDDDDNDDDDDDSALHEPMPYCFGGDVATS